MNPLRPYLIAARNCVPAKIRRLAARAGEYVGAADGDSFPNPESSFRRLKGLGVSVDKAIDFGAYEGTWTRTLREIFPRAEVLMVEAQASKAAPLKKLADASAGKVELMNALLAAEAGKEVTFFEMETGSSVFEEASDFPRQAVVHRTETLDRLVASRPRFKSVDLLKLDVQGYELEILNGGRETLSAAQFVLLEVSLLGINKSAPLFADVISYMKAAGFVAFDLCGYGFATGRRLWQVDMMFINTGHPLATVDRL